MAQSINVFVLHSGGWATIMKFVFEIDTTVLEFCKPTGLHNSSANCSAVNCAVLTDERASRLPPALHD
ncbi:hypothetical protein EVAR_37727_1 [Eumeta japonica]|uniref:Uncharacterized protein n=1 Tax=Eumeta variegata TaxID=151549 RepID=A0A4C1YNM8_EUMVA|nr:hypothetical protein EVAR_37727_1 [Eumeta japonica]